MSHGRQLATLTQSGTTWNYAYDASGMRTSRSNGTSTYEYVYNGSQLVQMKLGSNTLNFTYDAAGVPLTVTYNGTKYYYTTNIQGDVVAILDSSGTQVASYTYDAWGNCLTAPTSGVGLHNPLRYRGYVYDRETELYYLQSRYYDPEVGRFINADGLVSTGQGFVGNNMFAYCLNGPVISADYSGYDAIILLDKKFPTHIGIMVQDENGVWQHFYWGSGAASSSSNDRSSASARASGRILATPWGDVPAKTSCHPYTGELDIESINASNLYDDYEKMCYLSGDFSSCISEMEPTGDYNLMYNNCSQVSLGILAKADTKYKDALSRAAKRTYPARAFNRIMFEVSLIHYFEALSKIRV